MLVESVELESALQIREDPSELGAVGAVTMYLAGLRDGTVSRKALLMQALSLPECEDCALLTETVLAQPSWAPHEQLGAAVWVTDVVEDTAGRAWITVGMEQIVTVLGEDGTPVPTRRYRSLWDFDVEHTTEGWAVRAITVNGWA